MGVGVGVNVTVGEGVMVGVGVSVGVEVGVWVGVRVGVNVAVGVGVGVANKLEMTPQPVLSNNPATNSNMIIEICPLFFHPGRVLMVSSSTPLSKVCECLPRQNQVTQQGNLIVLLNRLDTGIKLRVLWP